MGWFPYPKLMANIPFSGYVRAYQGTLETTICCRKNCFHRSDNLHVTRNEHMYIWPIPGKNICVYRYVQEYLYMYVHTHWTYRYRLNFFNVLKIWLHDGCDFDYLLNNTTWNTMNKLLSFLRLERHKLRTGWSWASPLNLSKT